MKEDKIGGNSENINGLFQILNLKSPKDQLDTVRLSEKDGHHGY